MASTRPGESSFFSLLNSQVIFSLCTKMVEFRDRERMMRWVAAPLMLVLLIASSVAAAEYERRQEEEEIGRQKGLFLLEKSKQVVKTEAGEVRIVKGVGREGSHSPMHLGFISMEPNSLYVPQYLDSSLILFVRRGEAKVGWIHKDGFVENQLKIGDILRIPAGSTFYIANTGHGQRLQVISSIDTSQSLLFGEFQTFYLTGGSNPTSVLAGFDLHTLATAFNISTEELEPLMRKGRGPIIYTKGDAGEQGKKKLTLLRQKQEDELLERESKWSWRKLLTGWNREKQNPTAAYNLYERDPDFKNNYGWSIAVGKEDYTPLKHSGLSVFLVNLTAGAMMAPHINPRAAEYGVILEGEGSVQVVFPNGTLAMNAEVKEGDVFWVPRFFPFCQIASRSGAMEFFGFSTSEKKNRPQFLAGGGSILGALVGPELAAAFGAEEEELREIAGAQRESTILPPWPGSEREPK